VHLAIVSSMLSSSAARAALLRQAPVAAPAKYLDSLQVDGQCTVTVQGGRTRATSISTVSRCISACRHNMTTFADEGCRTHAQWMHKWSSDGTTRQDAQCRALYKAYPPSSANREALAMQSTSQQRAHPYAAAADSWCTSADAASHVLSPACCSRRSPSSSKARPMTTKPSAAAGAPR
jgi:hypothetical protein